MALQGTHEELIALLEDAEASERSVDATVQMLRLLSMPTRDIQQAFLSGRELCVQTHLKSARITAHGTAQHACGVQDASAVEAAAQWQSVNHFLEALGENVFPPILKVCLSCFSPQCSCSGSHQRSCPYHPVQCVSCVEPLLCHVCAHSLLQQLYHSAAGRNQPPHKK